MRCLTRAVSGIGFVDTLRERGSDEIERNGSRYFQCPAHEDRRASLTARQGERGMMVKCHAGCGVEEVLAALQLRVADLFGDTQPK